MRNVVLTDAAIQRRRFWVSEIVTIGGNFGQDSARIELELTNEVARSGIGAILDHLRLCGAIPESYGHDSSEEKLYAKYTDLLLTVAFRSLSLTALVLKGRSGGADVEVVGPRFSFVADAKAFRLSRTAKNQKDFKVQAMDGWRLGKDFAILVCPLYQFPSRSSQIYQQAIARNVCLLSFAHVAVLVAYGNEHGNLAAQTLLGSVLNSIATTFPSDSAVDYLKSINQVFLRADHTAVDLWSIEKVANLEAIAFAKQEGREFLARERASIMQLSRDEAIARLISVERVDGRLRAIESTKDNGFLTIS